MSEINMFDLQHGSGARISACQRYRYWLMRRWTDGPRVVYVMLNPSTADAHADDPTIRRCIGFAKSLGYGGLEVVNLYAYRSTSPDAMFTAYIGGVDIIGPECDTEIVRAVKSAGLVIAAWGADDRATKRAGYVLDLVSSFADVHCLARSGKGAPRHPLYLPSAARPEIYRARVAV